MVIPAFSSIARFSSGDIEATRAATLRVIASASSSKACSFRRLRSYSSRRSCFSMYCSCMELPDNLNAPSPVPRYISKSRKRCRVLDLRSSRIPLFSICRVRSGLLPMTSPTADSVISPQYRKRNTCALSGESSLIAPSMALWSCSWYTDSSTFSIASAALLSGTSSPRVPPSGSSGCTGRSRLAAVSNGSHLPFFVR